MFKLEFTPEGAADLEALRTYDQKHVVKAIESQLLHEADQETRNRKRLRPNQLAEWELRVGDFRVFYDVSGVEVQVLAIIPKTEVEAWLGEAGEPQ